MAIWVREAMDPKVEPGELEEFFASEDKLLPDKRQELLDKPRAKMEAELKYLYFNWKYGIQNPGPMFGDVGEGGRMPWAGPDGPPRDGGGPNRPPGIGREPRPDGPPGERRQRNRPPRPPGDRPPLDQKPEAI
jgi:hypothetical protein